MPSFFISPTPWCDYYRVVYSNRRTCTFPVTCSFGSWGVPRCRLVSRCKNVQVRSNVKYQDCCHGYSGNDCSGCELGKWVHNMHQSASSYSNYLHLCTLHAMLSWKFLSNHVLQSTVIRSVWTVNVLALWNACVKKGGELHSAANVRLFTLHCMYTHKQ